MCKDPEASRNMLFGGSERRQTLSGVDQVMKKASMVKARG